MYTIVVSLVVHVLYLLMLLFFIYSCTVYREDLQQFVRGLVWQNTLLDFNSPLD